MKEMYFAGVDIGSRMTKVVIMGEEILTSHVVSTGPEQRKLANKVMEEALAQAKLSFDDLTYVVATGYGRINVPFADKQITEISCHARGVGHLLPEVVRTLFSRRFTVHFPFRPLELPDYFRGRVAIQPELCQGCGLCARDCPASALELERTGRDQFRLTHYQDRCAYCGQCADDCRQGALTLLNEFVPASPRRDDLAQVLVKREGPAESAGAVRVRIDLGEEAAG